jgi:hypothetical protein
MIPAEPMPLVELDPFLGGSPHRPASITGVRADPIGS